MNQDHYLKRELYELMQSSPMVFEFLQVGSLDGLWYRDLEDQEHEWMSPRFWKVLGYDPAERQHLVSEWQELLFDEDLPAVLDNFEEHCADPSHPYDQVVRYQHRDGSTVWARCRGVAIHNEQGKPVRLLGAHTDLTKLKQTEERLREKSRELEAANARLRRALDRIGELEAILPVCMYCKRIQGDDEEWSELPEYLARHTRSRVSHGMWPDCGAEHFPAHAEMVGG